MIRRKITINVLDPSSVDRALQQVRDLQRELAKKIETFNERFCTEIADRAQAGFNAARVEDDVVNGMRSAEVKVTCQRYGDVYTIIAQSDNNDAMFAEFGAGVFYNGTAGTSPHEWAINTTPAFLIGMYGKGKGSYDVWGFYDENDELVLTRGTPASKPLWNAVQEAMISVQALADEVFHA